MADERSFTSAGKTLGLTQSAVSQQIRLLERELGAELVIRSNKLVGLTAAGEILRQSANRILDSLEQARGLIAERSTDGGGHLSVGAPSIICHRLMPSVVAAFHKQFPATHLSIVVLDQSDAVDTLLRREVDFALTLSPVRHKALSTMDVGRDEVVVIISDQNSLSRLDRLQAGDLQAQPMILPPKPNSEYAVWSGFMLEAGVFPRITLETDSLELAIELAHGGQGLTVAPRWAIAASPKGFSAVSIGKTGLWRNWVITYPASLRLTSIHRSFMRICSEQLSHGFSGVSQQATPEIPMNWERSVTTD